MNTSHLQPINLANLSEKTEQEVFDWVVSNLLRQGRKSLQLGIRCAYRGEDNTRCAAGWLIDDSEYKPLFEGFTWDELTYEFNEVPTTHQDLIVRLQEVHDESDEFTWAIKFKSVADEFELNYDHIS